MRLITASRYHRDHATLWLFLTVVLGTLRGVPRPRSRRDDRRSHAPRTDTA